VQLCVLAGNIDKYCYELVYQRINSFICYTNQKIKKVCKVNLKH